MKVAIIGGIGSGKSEVLRVAEELGLSTLSADIINAELLENPAYISQIADSFPNSVENGVIDRKKLAETVFSNDEARARLNALAHPRILARIKSDERDPLIVEMPLLVESGAEGMFDEIVLITAPLSLRIKRLEGRGMSKKHAESRINAQVDEGVLKGLATRVIDNSLGIEELRKNARELFKEIANIR